MKRMSKGEGIFLIYSIINLIIIWCATENIGILNADIAFGVTISWLSYMYSFLIHSYIVSMFN